MKKLGILLLAIMLAVGTLGCGTEKNKEDVTNEKKTTAKEEKLENEENWAENIVNTWTNSVLNEYDFENQFDTNVYTESSGEYMKSLLKEGAKIKVIYSEDKLILGHLSQGTETSGYFALVLENDKWVCTENTELENIYCQQICSQCSGVGVEVVGTHTEYGRYACATCGGTGWTTTTYYDAILGWQTMQAGCGGCGNAGWLYGEYTVDDYGTCKVCEGEGAFVIEGDLDLDSN